MIPKSIAGMKELGRKVCTQCSTFKVSATQDSQLDSQTTMIDYIDQYVTHMAENMTYTAIQQDPPTVMLSKPSTVM